MVPEQPEREQFSLFHPGTKLFSEMNTIGMLAKKFKTRYAYFMFKSLTKPKSKKSLGLHNNCANLIVCFNLIRLEIVRREFEKNPLSTFPGWRPVPST